MAKVPLAGTNWIPGRGAGTRLQDADIVGATGGSPLSLQNKNTTGELSWRPICRRSRKTEDQIFPDQLCRSLRRAARQAGAGRSHRRDAARRRRFRRLRHLAGHDPGPSRHVRQARSGQPDPAALEARGRLARRRSVDGRQGGRGPPARHAEAPDRRGGQAGLPDEDRRRVRVLPALPPTARRSPIRSDHAGEALLRPVGPDAPLST